MRKADVIILAGGLGTRLKGAIGDIPKCMAPLDGRPFIDYQLSFLNRAGYNRIILSIGHQKEMIIKYLERRRINCEIIFAIEEEPLGTGGAVLNALKFCTTDDVLLLNGDTLFIVDVSRLFECKDRCNAEMVLALRQVQDASRYGSVEIDGEGKVRGFREKSNKLVSGLVNGGVYLMHRSIVENSGLNGRFSLENDLLPIILEDRRMYGVRYDNYFIDIGIPEDLKRAEQEIPQLGIFEWNF